MTERLDRIEAMIERSEQRQVKRDEEIDTLLGAVATTEAIVQKTAASVEKLTTKIEGNERLFETLRSEATADRLETRRLWNDAIAQMETDRAETKAAREENARRFDAQQEIMQRLLIELVEMNRDNRRLRDRFDNLEQAS